MPPGSDKGSRCIRQPLLALQSQWGRKGEPCHLGDGSRPYPYPPHCFCLVRATQGSVEHVAGASLVGVGVLLSFHGVVDGEVVGGVGLGVGFFAHLEKIPVQERGT